MADLGELEVVQLSVVQPIEDHQLAHCHTIGHFVVDNLDIDHIDLADIVDEEGDGFDEAVVVHNLSRNLHNFDGQDIAVEQSVVVAAAVVVEGEVVVEDMEDQQLVVHIVHIGLRVDKENSVAAAVEWM